MPLPNRDPDTGTRYGYISANSLDPDVVDEMMYGSQATDLTYQQALEELKATIEREAEHIEEEALIALGEVDYALRHSDAAQEDAIDAAYTRRGYDDREDFIATRTEQESEHIQIDEPIHEGELDGVQYRTSWLGGALHVWAFESPHTGLYAECSPCVPGAGNLDCPDVDGVLTYDVPADWRASE